MRLEFDLYKLKKEYENANSFLKTIKDEEFIVTGMCDVDEELHYKVQPVNETGIKLINGLDIQCTSYVIPIKFFDKKEFERVTLDIPKKYLTLDIIEDIQRLN